jgi:uncharacterized protein (TIGR02145 family)
MKYIITTLLAISLSLGVYAQNDTMFIHRTDGTILEIATKSVDSIIFYRVATPPPPPINVTGVTLNHTTVQMGVSGTLQLTATVLPANADNKNVTWSSSNNSFVTVSTNGLITAVALGTATITVTTVDGGKTANCVVTVSPPGPGLEVASCNNVSTPAWGATLGTITFASSQEWTIEGDGYTQIWSDAVRASNCNKATYNGGTEGNYSSDCRNNGGAAYKGNYFSWCAIAKFKNVLCPAPWRVPTREDFCKLDQAMYGTTTCNNRVGANTAATYIGMWGGEFAGNVQQDGQIVYHGSNGYYWSESEWTEMGGARYGSYLWFTSNAAQNYAYPQYGNDKFRGTVLRCVKDN